MTCQARSISPGFGVYVRTRDLQLLVGIRYGAGNRATEGGYPTSLNDRPRAVILEFAEATRRGQLGRPQDHRVEGAGRAGRGSSQTGSGLSTTEPSARNTRNRSNERANHLSWVTASTVPSYADR